MDQQFSVSLPEEMAAHIRANVASGRYASENQVIVEGLRALEDRDQSVEIWLRREVAAAYDELEADPARGRSLADLQDTLTATRKRLAAERA